MEHNQIDKSKSTGMPKTFKQDPSQSQWEVNCNIDKPNVNKAMIAIKICSNMTKKNS